jgi:chaperone required for assembly of F1-ATPase
VEHPGECYRKAGQGARWPCDFGNHNYAAKRQSEGQEKKAVLPYLLRCTTADETTLYGVKGLMRDIFEEIFAKDPQDAMEAARSSMRQPLRRRFYEKATVEGGPEGFAVLLDGKPVRTPARRTLSAPCHALAEALAAEWDAQQEVVNPVVMPLTRLANSIIDGVAQTPLPVAEEITQYLGSDLLFYRAEGPRGLVERQERQWDPILAWARDVLRARFVLAVGVMFVKQPDGALTAAKAVIPTDAWRLGAVSSITTLTGSALVALAMLRGRLSIEEAWAAAHVDEDWNMEFWGRDERALERRAFRFAEMLAAAEVLRLAPAP